MTKIPNDSEQLLTHNLKNHNLKKHETKKQKWPPLLNTTPWVCAKNLFTHCLSEIVFVVNYSTSFVCTTWNTHVIVSLFSFLHAEWTALPDDIKTAWETVGYTEELWAGDGAVEANDSDFAELTEAQQAAVLAIGYTEESWNASE